MYSLEGGLLRRPVAENDLDGIIDFIAEDNPERAASFAAELRAKAEGLPRPRACASVPQGQGERNA